jgi:YD repeat-containing protein
MQMAVSCVLPSALGAGPLASPITTLTYDARGNVISQTESRGNETTYEYDERDRLARMTGELAGGSFPFRKVKLRAAICRTSEHSGRSTERAQEEKSRQLKESGEAIFAKRCGRDAWSRPRFRTPPAYAGGELGLCPSAVTGCERGRRRSSGQPSVRPSVRRRLGLAFPRGTP